MIERVKVFTDKYPLLGPIIWVLSLEYFIAQLIVATAWAMPAYNWRLNPISDLGNSVCGVFDHRSVCSPEHIFMNIAFIVLGLIMSVGSLLIYKEFRESKGTRFGFSLMSISGLGAILVGLFPENTVSILHSLGAGLPFFFGNLSLIVLSLYLDNVEEIIRLYTFVSGAIPMLALSFYVNKNYLNLGIGGLERLIAYPQTIWLIFFGIYMCRRHYINKKVAR